MTGIHDAIASHAVRAGIPIPLKGEGRGGGRLVNEKSGQSDGWGFAIDISIPLRQHLL